MFIILLTNDEQLDPDVLKHEQLDPDVLERDLMAFIGMFLILIIAAEVTIQVIIYHNWPLDWELTKHASTSPIYMMFLTKVEESRR